MRTALIAGIVAAIVAATSSTAATLVITSKHIKNGTIQAVDLSAAAKRALKGARGARGAIGPQGPQGLQGPQGIQGPPGLQRVRFVASPAVDIAPGPVGGDPRSARADAFCSSGEIAIAGGFLLDGTDAAVHQSVGTGSVWTVWAENAAQTTANDIRTAKLTAYAYCASGVEFRAG
jgi:hypothetical protein